MSYSYNRTDEAVRRITASNEQNLKKWADQLKSMSLPDDHREFMNLTSQVINLAGPMASARVKEDPSWVGEYRAVVTSVNSMVKALTDGRLNRAMGDDDHAALAKLVKSVSTAAAKVAAAF